MSHPPAPQVEAIAASLREIAGDPGDGVGDRESELGVFSGAFRDYA